jgi:tetratricopeptide (TPR) repeat protein
MPQKESCDRWAVGIRFLAALFLFVMAGAEAQHENGAGEKHEHSGAPLAAAELGSVSFQTSCTLSVEANFNRGITLLHSFWHDEARRTFDAVVETDPDCAIAYWGQAMAWFHLYSGRPTESDLAAIGEALKRAGSASKKSAREVAYIEAMHALTDGFIESPDPVFARRFAEAMRDVAARFPDDADAKAFHALALLASIAPGDTSLANERKAVEVMSPALRDNPDHPGLIHYTIHACDHPGMAQKGLEAALRYARVAPAAPHALHMPSHIFARLGVWEESIRSNLASKVASEITIGPRIGAENRLHAMEFLQYAYLQSGRFDEAAALVAEAQTVQSGDTSYQDYYHTVQARFALLLAVETQDWAMARDLAPVPDAHWYSEAHTILARAMSAGHLRDAQTGVKVAKEFAELLATANVPLPLPTGTSAAHLHDEIVAWTSFAQGDSEKAFSLLRPIAATQAKVGKGEVELPAREMLADMLLLDHKPADALVQYRLSLEADPNRFNGLLGAAHAAEQSGRRAVAARYYRQLVETSPSPSGKARDIVSQAKAGKSAGDG